MQAADATGKVLFPEALVEFRTGDMPLCEDWMLQIFHTVRHQESFTLTCKGGHARALVSAVAKLFDGQKQRPIDGAALGAHVEKEGLCLLCTVRYSALQRGASRCSRRRNRHSRYSRYNS